MTFGQSYLDHMRCLEDVGMLSTTPINFNGQEIVPIQFLKALLPDPASLGPRTKGKTNICLLYTSQAHRVHLPRQPGLSGTHPDLRRRLLALRLCQQEVPPVSYTHLDVYKRQVFKNGLTLGHDSGEHTVHGSAHADLIKDCLLYTSRCV